MSELPKQAKPRSDRAEWTYGKILRAAGLVFEKKGYEGATVNEICETADVTKGALYYHFKDGKVDMATAILESTLNVDGLVQQEITLQMVIDTGMILAYHIRREAQTRAALRLSLTHDAREVYGTPWPDWIKINTAQLDEARQKGEILPGVDTASQAHQIAGTWSGLVLTSHALYGNLEGIEARVATMYENLLTAIAHPSYLRKLNFDTDRPERLVRAFLEKKG
ncbi:TetR/AcrR family transcriptional regulator [Streptomyces sp. NPDC051572]|uniref:TetR/AcrR family transcriptional regulator n=1 Tax=Streptomyces sp. NPDC051572 TaxID=3155802 RepID=UPI003450FB45